MTSNTAPNPPTLHGTQDDGANQVESRGSDRSQQMVQRTALVRGVRRGAVVAIIVSLSLTALVGIVVLVTGGFGEVQGRILLTALLVAGFSITALCDLAIAARSLRAVAALGLVVSTIALALGTILIWRDWSDVFWSDGLRWFAISGVWAVSIAQVSLLLLLAGRRRLSIRVGLGATIVVIGVVAVFVSLPILTNGEIPGSGAPAYWRVFGVFVIIDALGTIVVPVISLFLRDGTGASVQAGGDVSVGVREPRSITIVLTAADDARLSAVALEADTTRERVAEYAITAHLDEVSPLRGPGDEAGAR